MTQNDFKISFLSQFTKELFRATDSYLELRIKHETKKKPIDEKLESSQTPEQKKEIKDIVAEKFRAERKSVSILRNSGDEKLREDISRKPRILQKSKERNKIIENKLQPIPKQPLFRVPQKRFIQEPELPETVRNIMPSQTQEQIELGKVNPLAQDPLVKTIECDGSGENLFVTGMMGRKKTPIVLNKNEINAIIQRFSQTAKIPLQDGFFKAAVGRFVLSAIISENPRFILRKI